MTTDLGTAQTQLSERVAEEIRALMARRMISGRQLATLLGVSPSWVSYRLTGMQPIDLNDLALIAKALGARVLDLLPNDLQTEEPPPAPPTQRDHRGRRRRDSTNRVYASFPDQGKPFGQVRPPTWSSRSGSAPRDVRPLPRPASPAWAKTARRAA